MDQWNEITIRWDPQRGPPQRVRFEPHSSDEWMRLTEVWTGCTWRCLGTELVENVSVEQPAAACEIGP